MLFALLALLAVGNPNSKQSKQSKEHNGRPPRTLHSATGTGGSSGGRRRGGKIAERPLRCAFASSTSPQSRVRISTLEGDIRNVRDKARIPGLREQSATAEAELPTLETARAVFRRIPPAGAKLRPKHPDKARAIDDLLTDAALENQRADRAEALRRLRALERRLETILREVGRPGGSP